MASRCTLSEFILSAGQPNLRRALKSRSAPLPGFKMSAQEEAVTGQCQKETLILFIVCGQTAGVFGSGWNCSHSLLLFLVISHQGHLLADTIRDAVNTM